MTAKGKWEVGCQSWPGPFTVPCTDPNSVYVRYIARLAVSRKDFKKTPNGREFQEKGFSINELTSFGLGMYCASGY